MSDRFHSVVKSWRTLLSFQDGKTFHAAPPEIDSTAREQGKSEKQKRSYGGELQAGSTSAADSLSCHGFALAGFFQAS